MHLYRFSATEAYYNLVDNDYRRAVVWTYLKTDSTAYAASLWERCERLIAAEFPPGVTVRIGGGLPQTVAINASLVDTKVRSILQMAVVVLVLSGLALGSLVGGFLVVAPLIAIVLVNFGFMGWVGASLDMGTATIVAMVVGIGADYEIYMLSRLREEYARLGDLNQALRTSLLTSGKAASPSARPGSPTSFGMCIRRQTPANSNCPCSMIPGTCWIRCGKSASGFANSGLRAGITS